MIYANIDIMVYGQLIQKKILKELINENHIFYLINYIYNGVFKPR